VPRPIHQSVGGILPTGQSEEHRTTACGSMRGLRSGATRGKWESFRKWLKLTKPSRLGKDYGLQVLHSAAGRSLWHCLLLQPTTEIIAKIASKPIQLCVRNMRVLEILRSRHPAPFAWNG